MLNRKLLCLAVAATALLAAGCTGKSKKEYYQRRPFPEVQLPVAITDDTAKLDFYLEHFWDRYLDSTRTYLCDSLLVNGVHNRELTQQAVMFSTVVARSSWAKGKEGLRIMMDKAAALQRQDTSSTVFRSFAELFREIFYGVDSPYRDEDKYSFLASYLAESPLTPENMKASYRYEVKMCSLNKVGTKATDFEYIDRYGKKHTLYGTEAEYLLVIFLHPGCNACTEVVDALEEGIVLKMMRQGRLTILGVYIDEDLDAWKEKIDGLPAGWKDGYDPYGIIRRDILYNVRAIPSLYMLDKDKTVLLKDAPIQSVSTFILNHEKD